MSINTKKAILMVSGITLMCFGTALVSEYQVALILNLIGGILIGQGTFLK